MKLKQAIKVLNELMEKVDSKHGLIQPFLDHFSVYWKDSVKIDGDKTTTDNTRLVYYQFEYVSRDFQIETADDLKRLVKKYPFLKLGIGGRSATATELRKHANLGTLASIDRTNGDIWLVGTIGTPSFRIAVKCLEESLDYMSRKYGN